MKGINCNIIKDLLPSYVDKICTEDSRRLIEEHIGGCEQCRTQLKLLQGTELTDEQGEQRRISYLKKLKRHYEKGITSLVLLTLAIIGASLFLVGHNDRNLLYVIFPPVSDRRIWSDAGQSAGGTAIEVCGSTYCREHPGKHFPGGILRLSCPVSLSQCTG